MFIPLTIVLLVVPWQFAVAQTAPLAPCTLTDIDINNNGLIEICDLEGLNAIRYQLDGTGYKASDTATKITTGCPPSGCNGYELARDLDFQDNGSYRDAAANKDAWTVSDYTDASDQGWEPINNSSAEVPDFNFIFKANRYTISNLTINRTRSNYIGLFGIMRLSRVEGVRLNNADVRGRNYVGSLVGDIHWGTISDSHAAHCNVQGEFYVGGLVGTNSGSIITDSYTSGRVIGERDTGGLVGQQYFFLNSREFPPQPIPGKTINSRASVNVIGNGLHTGGLIGWLHGDIENSHADGHVQGDFAVGGLAGYSQPVRIFNLLGYNFISDNYIRSSSATGNVQGNETVGGLIGYNFTGSYVSDSWASGRVTCDQVVGGLVGNNGGGDIADSYAVGNIKGVNYVGGLVGLSGHSFSYDSTFNIRDSYATGNVEGTTYVGGLVGTSGFSDITNSYATGNVKGIDYVGGLIGENQSGRITNNYTNNNVEGERYVGGLIGHMFGVFIPTGFPENIDVRDFNTHIIGNYTSGDVTGEQDVGGLIGYNEQGNILNNYAIGSVEGEQNVGGLVGNLIGDTVLQYKTGTITNSYAISEVSGVNDVGGLVGTTAGTVIITTSHWNTDTSTQAMSAGGTAKTTAELQSPTAPGTTSTEVYYNWSIHDWDFGTSEQYPALKHTDSSLLSNQRIGLSDLILLGDMVLSQPYNAEVFNYRVINDTHLTQLQLIATANNSSASIIIRSVGGFIERIASGTMSSVIPLNTNGATKVIVEVSAKNDAPIQYTLDVNNNTFKEGEHILLDGSTNLETDIDTTTFQWRQTSGIPLLPSAVEQAVLDIRIPEDFVERASINSEITLRLIIRSGGRVVTRKDLSLTIIKINNGTTQIDTSITLRNDTLVAPMGDLSGDPDGSGLINENSYQWQSRAATNADWTDIVGNTINTYAPPENTLTYTEYRVRFSYTDGQGYTHFLRSKEFVFATDIDKDDDGLIEITYLEDLNAIRYQPDGSGYRASNATSKTTRGCRIGGCNGYELVSNLDFNDDRSYRAAALNKEIWTTDLGWPPIGNADAPFNGIFNANGNTISNLRINSLTSEKSIGLFGVTTSKARFDNVGLLNVDIIGGIGVGALVGDNKGGVIVDSYVTGQIVGKGEYDVGGLVGWNDKGTIIGSYSNSTVTGSGTNTGGLVGFNEGGTITDSYAAGHVTGNEKTGGLVGATDGGTIAQCYATARVDGGGAVGGLVGENKDVILNSHTTGNIFGGADVGGLVGWNSGNVMNSYTTANVRGNNEVGGFIGNNFRGTITNSYARGDVVGVNRYIGGFIGWSARGMVINSYAHGSVSGKAYIGSFIGVNVGRFNSQIDGMITKSYAVGKVKGNKDIGGLISENRQGTITNSYWNKTNNPTTTSAGGTSQTTAELQSPVEPGNNPNEVYYDWNTDDWDFAPNDQYPAIKYTDGAEGTACGGDLQPKCGQLLPGQRSEDVDPNDPQQGMRTVTIMLRVLLEGLLE